MIIISLEQIKLIFKLNHLTKLIKESVLVTYLLKISFIECDLAEATEFPERLCIKIKIFPH